MLPLPADAFFQLLQLIVGLVPPQVLQPLGGWAGAAGGGAVPSAWGVSCTGAGLLRIHVWLCFGCALLPSPLPRREPHTCLDSRSPQGDQDRLVIEVADLGAVQSWGVCAVQVPVGLLVPGVALVDQLAEQRIWGRRRGWVRGPWHWVQAVGLQLRGGMWWRGGLSGDKPDYMGLGRGFKMIYSSFTTHWSELHRALMCGEKKANRGKWHWDKI